MTRLLSDLVQPGSSACNKTATVVTIRRCQHNDYARIGEICRNVYGGTDYIPRMIHHFVQRPDTTVLVSQTAAGAGSVNGVMCGHKRGSAYFLFGLRVAEEARGKGLARALMEAVCGSSEEFGPIQSISSTTIPENPATVHLFNTLGFKHTHTVDVWPSYEALSRYEREVDVQLTGAPPRTEQLQEQPNMLDVLGLRDMLVEQNSAAVQLQDWVQCSSAQQLQEAIASIRTQQMEQADLQQVVPIIPMEQLPWAFEMFPLDAPWTQQRLVEGQIWLLPYSRLQNNAGSAKLACSNSTGSVSTASGTGGSRSCSTSSLTSFSISSNSEGDRGPSTDASEPAASRNHRCQQGFAALVVVGFSQEMRRYCAGVMTTDDAYIAGALQLVASQLPYFLCFCDRGSKHSSGKPDPHVLLPAVITETGPALTASCFIAYARESIIAV